MYGSDFQWKKVQNALQIPRVKNPPKIMASTESRKTAYGKQIENRRRKLMEFKADKFSLVRLKLRKRKFLFFVLDFKGKLVHVDFQHRVFDAEDLLPEHSCVFGFVHLDKISNLGAQRTERLGAETSCCGATCFGHLGPWFRCRRR